jgi:hypothetical protein
MQLAVLSQERPRAIGSWPTAQAFLDTRSADLVNSFNQRYRILWCRDDALGLELD